MKKLIFLILPFIAFSCVKNAAQVEPVTVEFRVAETEPAAGLVETVFEPTGEKFYVHQDASIDNVDVVSAKVNEHQGSLAIDIRFSDQGSGKFALMTSENVEKHIAILVDGKLISAPIVKAPILNGRALIISDFTKAEADRIAAGIMKR